jgi:hypothetical protein
MPHDEGESSASLLYPEGRPSERTPPVEDSPTASLLYPEGPLNKRKRLEEDSPAANLLYPEAENARYQHTSKKRRAGSFSPSSIAQDQSATASGSIPWAATLEQYGAASIIQSSGSEASTSAAAAPSTSAAPDSQPSTDVASEEGDNGKDETATTPEPKPLHPLDKPMFNHEFAAGNVRLLLPDSKQITLPFARLKMASSLFPEYSSIADVPQPYDLTKQPECLTHQTLNRLKDRLIRGSIYLPNNVPASDWIDLVVAAIALKMPHIEIDMLDHLWEWARMWRIPPKQIVYAHKLMLQLEDYGDAEELGRFFAEWIASYHCPAKSLERVLREIKEEVGDEPQYESIMPRLVAKVVVEGKKWEKMEAKRVREREAKKKAEEERLKEERRKLLEEVERKKEEMWRKAQEKWSNAEASSGAAAMD